MPDLLLNLLDYEAKTKELLAEVNVDFIAGGATDELSIRRNQAAYDAIAFRPRMLTDVSAPDSSTTVLGQPIPFPVMITPAGGHTMAHPDGEVATIRGAGVEGVLMVVSCNASRELEDVVRAATGPRWFQQYLWIDRGYTLDLAQKAIAMGFAAICVTLDSRVAPKRERNMRHQGKTSVERRVDQFGNPGTTERDLEWFAANIGVPMVVKGIMTGEDAKLCVEHGAKAIIVSNHGGRQLDTTLASVEVLPEVVEAVEGRAEVYVDGGIRRGADVVKALALGARATLIGRPYYWGLAVGGADGVADVLRILREEFEMTMRLCGIRSAADLDRKVIAFAPLPGLPFLKTLER